MRHTMTGFFVLLVALLLWSSTSCADDRFGDLRSTQEAYQRSNGPFDSEQRLLLAYELGEARPPSVTVPSYLAFSNKELHVPNQLRLIVFSPHPDDEALSSAGIIQRVKAKGGQVRVVYVTNGDGYLDGVRCELDRKETTSQDFIEYGRLRHAEALQALHEMGLQPQDGIFLGFPDDGIDDLLDGRWSRLKPYTSPHTLLDYPQYKESFSQRVKYAGSDLVDEISRIMIDFVPDWVVLPDPRDRHPDHSSTGIFVLEALRKLRQDGNPSFADVQAFTYLVHYLDYPVSTKWLDEINQAGVCGSPVAYKTLSETQWFSLPVTQEELAGKRRALAAHRSQYEPLYYFLDRFLIRYELFGRLEPSQIMSVPTEYAWFGNMNRLSR